MNEAKIKVLKRNQDICLKQKVIETLLQRLRKKMISESGKAKR